MLLPPRKQELANAPRDSNANKDDLEEDGTGFDLGNEDGAAIAQQLLFGGPFVKENDRP